MQVIADPVVSYIQKHRLLDEERLQQVVKQSKQTGATILSILKAENLLDEEQMARVIAVANQIEFIELNPEQIDPIVAHLVSEELANRHQLIPVRLDNGRLVVAMANPMNLVVRDRLEIKTGYKVVPVAASPAAIRQAIHYHFDVANITKQAIASMRLKGQAGGDLEIPQVLQISDRVANDPVTKLVSSIIRGAIDARASDIHIEPQFTDVRVRYRVDGILRPTINIPISALAETVSHIKILAGMDISERRLPQDGHITIRHLDKDYDLRVSCLPAVGGEKVVIRILDKNTARWNIDTVVTSAQDNQAFRRLVANPYGMILLTGPTGCGKTTTLYALLQLLNTPGTNIVTVEDPVEYKVEGITQVQVKPVIGLTFASALRSILRQDPDVILIGEIRDTETAEIAVSAALTGHLVLSTLHTNDAAGAISRLVNLGVPPFLVGSALLGAVAQRLIRVNCPSCSRPYQANQQELELLKRRARKGQQLNLRHGQGCPDCYHSGYKGRKSIYEILTISNHIRRLTLDGANDDQIHQQAVSEGMRTLLDSALDEVIQGHTTLQEVSRVVEVRT
ncbi:MAG: GspE/PulE family protein [Sedimentisphaerales bacterium]|nr:GspE/PulE family protein [Sedimentisphaerales bacterium]